MVPSLTLKSSCLSQVKKGYPWIYRRDIASLKSAPMSPCVVTLVDDKQQPLAIGYYNPTSSLACRILTMNPTEPIDTAFFVNRLQHALARRNRFFDVPYYRLVHAESDQLPGLIIDRFNDTFVCQTNTAGMELLKPLWLSALIEVFSPGRVICKDDSPTREKEQLERTLTAPIGQVEGLLDVMENETCYYADPASQKTGWFYDHRANRLWVASRVKKKRVLDLFTFQGGFGILAARHQAAQVTLVDSSAHALSLCEKTASLNQLNNCEFVHSDVFEALVHYIAQQKTFEVVVADPPAFIKQLQHQAAGLRGYQKLARLCAQVVAKDGLLFIASCSHHAPHKDFRDAVEKGLTQANRGFELLRKAGADKDHPIHPLVPQTQYLKSLVYRLD